MSGRARSTPSPARAEEVVLFEVGGDRFALPLTAVEGIVPLGRHQDQEMEHGGERLAVRRAEVVLGFPPAPDPPKRGIVVRTAAGRLILAVSRAVAVEAFAVEGVEPPPPFLAGRTRELVRGIVAAAEGSVVLLEPDALRTTLRDEAEGIIEERDAG